MMSLKGKWTSKDKRLVRVMIEPIWRLAASLAVDSWYADFMSTYGWRIVVLAERAPPLPPATLFAGLYQCTKFKSHIGGWGQLSCCATAGGGACVC